MKEANEEGYDSGILEKYLWESMSLVRGELMVSEYLDYLLPLIFIKHLSNQFSNGDLTYGLDMPSKSMWSSLINEVELTGKRINEALGALEDSNPQIIGLFSHLDYDMLHRRIGQKLKTLFKLLDKVELSITPSFLTEFDDLLDRFADYIGYKGGEFRTPRSVSDLLVRLASPESGMTVCDPACGSGGLLTTSIDYVRQNNPTGKDIHLYGQEKSINTWALCRMNLLFRKITTSQIKVGDTLRGPELLDDDKRLLKFDRVISNPPMSLRAWGQEYAHNDVFERFKYGIPPKNHGDFAFIQHIISTLSDTGKAVIVIPYGPLFRRGAERGIRQNIVDEDLIEAVIALPAKILYGTGIRPAVLVINKKKAAKQQKKVLFIDATKRGQRRRSQAILRTVDLDWIEHAYHSQKTASSQVCRVGLEIIAKHDYSLDVARYIEGGPPAALVRPKGPPLRGKRFEQWIDDLPFPLASILWSYSSKLDPEQKSRTLLRFFEALSQFNTTLMLSAITADPDYYNTNFSGVITKDVFTMSSFGGWSIVGTRLASKIRKLLKNNLTQQECIDVFGGVDELIANLLSDTELGRILDDASKLRNKWSGHSGAVTKREYSRRLAELEVLLRKTRKIVKERYSSMILALPGIIERYGDGIYLNIVKELRGTRTPFREIRLETTSPLESDSLHFIADGGNTPIKLLPFLRIMHSPETEKNACYFYNRVEPEGIRWIAYQLQKESELTLPDDDDVEVIIKMLLSSKADR